MALQRAFLKNTENQVNNPLSPGATNRQTNEKPLEVNNRHAESLRGKSRRDSLGEEKDMEKLL